MLKSKVKTKVKDKKFRRYIKELEKLHGGSKIKIGILADKGSVNPPGSDLNLAGIASVTEFGTKTAGRNKNTVIPPRPWMRTTFESNRRRFNNLTLRELMKVGDGKSSVSKALTTLGVIMAASVKKTITNLKTPPNAPSTIAAKGSSNPLIDTARMRNSVDFEVDIQTKKLPDTFFKGSGS